MAVTGVQWTLKYLYSSNDAISKGVTFALRKRLKVPTFIMPRLTGKPEQQRFTVRIDALTSISSRQRSTISGRPLPE